MLGNERVVALVVVCVVFSVVTPLGSATATETTRSVGAHPTGHSSTLAEAVDGNARGGAGTDANARGGAGTDANARDGAGTDEKNPGPIVPGENESNDSPNKTGPATAPSGSTSNKTMPDFPTGGDGGTANKSMPPLPGAEPTAAGTGAGALLPESDHNKSELSYLEQIQYNDHLTGPTEWGPPVSELRNETAVARLRTNVSKQNASRVVRYDPDADRPVRTARTTSVENASSETDQQSTSGLFGSVPNGPNGSLRPANSGIIGADGRGRITDVLQFPWSATVELRIVTQSGQQGHCSGAIITEENSSESSYHVLTAGHCVYLHRSGGWLDVQPESVDGTPASRVVPAANGSQQPFGSFRIDRVRTYDGWKSGAKPGWDIALLTLEERVGNRTGSMGYTTRNESSDIYSDEPTHVAGYPGDKPAHTMWHDGGNATGTVANSTGPDRRHRYQMDIYPGMSGGPVWVTNYGNLSGRRIVSVNAYAVDPDRDGQTEVNWGTRITAERFDDFQQWMARDDRTGPKRRPDLVDDGTEWFEFTASSAQAGQRFGLQSHVRNVGSGGAGCFAVTYYFSTNQTIERSDHEVGTAQVCSLAPTEYTEATWTGRLPRSLPNGTYHVGWIIDDGDTVAESNESNNRAVYTNQTIAIEAAPENDRLEPNDEPSSATPVSVTTYEDLQVVVGEWDFYEINVTGGTRLSTEVTFDGSVGDLDVYAYTSDFTRVAGSASYTSNESFDLPVGESGTYYIGVKGYAGSSASYSLSFETSDLPDNDRFEPNNNLSAATSVSPGTYGNLSVIAGEWDVYEVQVDAGSWLSPSISFVGTRGDLDMYVLDANETVLGRSVSDTSNETLRTHVDESGTYYVLVKGYRRSTAPYSLTLTTSDAQANDRFEPNDNVSAATSVSEGTYEELRAIGSEWDTYSIQVDSGRKVSSRISFENASNDLDLYLVESVEGSLEVLGRSESYTDNESLEVTIADSGTYYVIVLARQSTAASYSLQLSTSDGVDDDRFEPNDNVSRAASVTPGTYENLQMIAGEWDSYSIQLDQGSSLSTAITFDHASGDLDLYAVGPNDELLNVSESSTSNESVAITANESGTYYLVVIGDDRATVPYEMRVQSAGPAVQPDRYLSETNISQGGESTVTLEGTITNGSITFREQFSPAFDAVRIETVTVDGRVVDPAVSIVEPAGLVVGIANQSAGTTARIHYTVSVDENASVGTVHTIQGSVTSGSLVSLPGDVLTVKASTDLDGIAGDYDEDGNDEIDLAELGAAAVDFARNEITLAELGQVAVVYAQS